MERVISIVGVLINPHQCWLGGKNLDFIILLINNWHGDSTISFEDRIGLVDLYGFGEVEEDILDVIDFEFLCEVQVHVEDSSKIGTCICHLVLFCSWCTCYLFTFAWTLTFMFLLTLSNRQWTSEMHVHRPSCEWNWSLHLVASCVMHFCDFFWIYTFFTQHGKTM